MTKIKHFFKNEILDYKLLLRNIPSSTILIFTLSVVCANLMANKELFSYKYFALDWGFAYSWIMFLCMDIICKRFGAKAAIKISILSLIANLLVCASFFLATSFGGNWGEYYNLLNTTNNATTQQIANTINKSLDKTIGGSWYVVIGSATAFLTSSIINALLNKNIGNLVESKLKKDNFFTFAVRSYISTFIAQFVDNFLFATIVSRVFFDWTWTQIIICSFFGAFCELLCEILFSGYGYKVLKKWQKHNIGKEYLTSNKE